MYASRSTMPNALIYTYTYTYQKKKLSIIKMCASHAVLWQMTSYIYSIYIHIHIFGVMYIHVWCNITFIFCIVTFMHHICVYVTPYIYMWVIWVYESTVANALTFTYTHSTLANALVFMYTHSTVANALIFTYTHTCPKHFESRCMHHTVPCQMPSYTRIHTHIKNSLNQEK